MAGWSPMTWCGGMTTGLSTCWGRADDIINVGGEKASPVEIENTASECPGVVECACIGVEDTDGVLGEVPALYLVPEHSDFDPAAVTKFLSPKLEKYKLPKKFVLVDALPRNAMGKLDRKELRRMWADSGDLKLTNPVMENMMARRSIRKFTDQPVPRRLIETLVKAGWNAPTGHNLQTWRFTVLTTQQEILSLKELVQATAKRCKTICYGFENPQALILVSNDRRNADGIQDASCAAENILLAATSFGLGATWINALMTLCDEPEIRAKLNDYQIPKTHNVWAMIAVGWPEQPGKALARKTNVVHFVDSPTPSFQYGGNKMKLKRILGRAAKILIFFLIAALLFCLSNVFFTPKWARHLEKYRHGHRLLRPGGGQHRHAGSGQQPGDQRGLRHAAVSGAGNTRLLPGHRAPACNGLLLPAQGCPAHPAPH